MSTYFKIDLRHGLLVLSALNRRGCLFRNWKEIQLGFQKTERKANKN